MYRGYGAMYRNRCKVRAVVAGGISNKTRQATANGR